MRHLTIVVFVLLIGSCNSKEDKKIIHYTYNGITITRIDTNSESCFYYGKCDAKQNACPVSFIKSEHPKGNDLMACYIVFGKEKVNLVKMYDYFEKVGADSSLNLIEYKDNLDFIHWEDSVKMHFANVARIDRVISLEQELNANNKSKVVVTY